MNRANGQIIGLECLVAAIAKDLAQDAGRDVNFLDNVGSKAKDMIQNIPVDADSMLGELEIRAAASKAIDTCLEKAKQI